MYKYIYQITVDMAENKNGKYNWVISKWQGSAGWVREDSGESNTSDNAFNEAKASLEKEDE